MRDCIVFEWPNFATDDDCGVNILRLPIINRPYSMQCDIFRLYLCSDTVGGGTQIICSKHLKLFQCQEKNPHVFTNLTGRHENGNLITHKTKMFVYSAE
jgi:hypothetical protein